MPEEGEQIQPQLNETIAASTQTRQQQETEEQKNFKAVRDMWRAAERERDEALRKLKQYETTSKPTTEDDDDILLGENELAEGKHLAKVNKKIKAQASRNKQLQDDLEQQRQQLSALIAEQTIKTRYPDFDAIVNEETVKQLRENYPDIAASINSNQDFISKASAAYTMIKNLNIAKTDTYSAERDRVQRNAAKPRPIASVAPQQGNSPLAQANAFAEGLTDEVKQQLWQETQQFRKNY